MGLVGRQRELAALDDLLDRAERGSGALLGFTGPAGSGKTALLDVAGERARARGFQVLRVSGESGLLAWAQLLRDAGAPDEVARQLLDEPGPLELDDAARLLIADTARLIIVDDVDERALLAVLAGRLAAGSTSVLVSSRSGLGIGRELRLGSLSEPDLAVLLGEVGVVDPGAVRTLLVASRGLPGAARAFAAELADLPAGVDPILHLALNLVEDISGFLIVDGAVLRLLELAVDRAGDDATRALVLARLARGLLGDASAAARRRALIDEAEQLARRSGDARTLGEVLAARLHALWAPDGVHDRLRLGAEIVALGRSSGDETLEWNGMFWQFTALMELGRVNEAESALALFENAVTAAGDLPGMTMARARHAMLAALRGRFDDIEPIAAEVEELGRRAHLADTWRLAKTIRVPLLVERDIAAEGPANVAALRAWARKLPGHFIGADLAMLHTELGQYAEAAAELERVLPDVLAGSGPRWLGAIGHLAFTAARIGHPSAARIYDALLPYRGRLILLAGANSTWGPASLRLGQLAARLGRTDEAIAHFTESLEFAESMGALPWVAHTHAEFDSEEHRAAARSIAERLGMTRLLARLAPPSDEWLLRRDGEDWLLVAGSEQARLRDGRGLHYLHALLSAPGKDISALDLVAGGAGLAPTTTDPLLDDTARAAYRTRLAALDDELDAADATGDADRARRAEQERQAILAELRRSTGLGGRARQTTAEAERARVNVTRTLRTAIDRIAAKAPKAGAHLRESVRTGLACRYDPAPGGPARWRR
ncbi:MAG TPA: ATP-binding protein [Pseudonocardiaceae bacterium]|nr:ATP-binding protein [Pseudonocardiaceae bacterium]